MTAPFPRGRCPLGLCAALACLLTAAPAPAGDKKDPDKDSPKMILSLSKHGQFGLMLLDGGEKKRITFGPEGQTNITIVSVDGKMYAFGLDRDAAAGVKLPPGLLAGKWVKKPAVLKPGISFEAVWSPVDKVEITQTVEIVRSKTGALDTCLVRYSVANKDAKAHQVGIRLLLDTLIGENDGHPFALPGKDELITTSADYKKDLPAVINALEKPDLKNPGLVARLSLKVGGGLEAPQRVSLTGFPMGPKDLVDWEVPVSNIMGDAVVMLYWNPRAVAAGARRVCGFDYGGGEVALPAKKNK